MIDPLTVDCPDEKCKAPAGERCVYDGTESKDASHPARLALAKSVAMREEVRSKLQQAGLSAKEVFAFEMLSMRVDKDSPVMALLTALLRTAVALVELDKKKHSGIIITG
jgi:hypothetical protein